MFINLKRAVFNIANIKYRFCPKLLKKMLADFPGILKVSFSFSNNILTVIYDSDIGDIKLMTQTIREIGFTAIYNLSFSLP